jgi:hypothetical protein
MRIVSEAVHPACKITVYHWNNRFLIKVEQNDLEQTFKVSALDLASEADVNRITSDEFIRECLERFDAMRAQLHRSLNSL